MDNFSAEEWVQRGKHRRADDLPRSTPRELNGEMIQTSLIDPLLKRCEILNQEEFFEMEAHLNRQKEVWLNRIHGEDENKDEKKE